MATKTVNSSPTAKVFLAALKSLPKKEQNEFYAALAKDRKLFEDLCDIALIEKRRHEPSRSLKEYTKEISK